METGTSCPSDDMVCIAAELLERWERIEREQPAADGRNAEDQDFDD